MTSDWRKSGKGISMHLPTSAGRLCLHPFAKSWDGSTMFESFLSKRMMKSSCGSTLWRSTDLQSSPGLQEGVHWQYWTSTVRKGQQYNCPCELLPPGQTGPWPEKDPRTESTLTKQERKRENIMKKCLWKCRNKVCITFIKIYWNKNNEKKYNSLGLLQTWKGHWIRVTHEASWRLGNYIRQTLGRRNPEASASPHHHYTWPITIGFQTWKSQLTALKMSSTYK